MIKAEGGKKSEDEADSIFDSERRRNFSHFFLAFFPFRNFINFAHLEGITKDFFLLSFP